MNGRQAHVAAGDMCPCTSGRAYTECCGPCHAGAKAPDCERLMRSRFSAYALRRPDYLLRTWHEKTRPPSLELENSPDWTSLQVLSVSENAARGLVHFRAIHRSPAQPGFPQKWGENEASAFSEASGSGDALQGQKKWGFLEEHAEFHREQDEWFYLGGTVTSGTLKPGRNEPCPCGSQRKYKSCCA